MLSGLFLLAPIAHLGAVVFHVAPMTVDGDTVVFDYIYDGFPYNVLSDGKSTPSIFVEDYTDDLTMRSDCELLGTKDERLLHGDDYDIVKIEQNSKTIWERE